MHSQFTFYLSQASIVWIGEYKAECLWLKELCQSGHLLPELRGMSSDVSDCRLIGKWLRKVGPLLVKIHRAFLLTLVHNIPIRNQE